MDLSTRHTSATTSLPGRETVADQIHDDFEEMYSVQDHDESEVDVESDFDDTPTDGYFVSRQHPTATYVPQSTALDSKHATVIRPRREQSQHDHFPILDAGPAPPDYAAATADRSYSYRTYSEADYGSISRPDGPSVPSYNIETRGDGMEARRPSSAPDSPFGPGGVFSRNGLFPSAHRPQSMRDEAHGLDEETALLEMEINPQASRKPSQSRLRRSARFLARSSAALLTLALVILVVCRFVAANNNHSSNGNESHKPVTGNPIQNPGSGHDAQPGFGSSVPPAIDHSSTCPFNRTQMVRLELPELDTLSVIEATEDYGVLRNHIGGAIYVRAGQPKQKELAIVWVSYAVSEPYAIEALNYEFDRGGSLILRIPHLNRQRARMSQSMQQPCMDISIIVEVRPGLRLEEWNLASRNLHSYIQGGLFNENHTTDDPSLVVDSYASFSNVRGDLHADYWSSRRTEISVVSGTVDGTFALRDYLSVKTISGSQKLIVRPKKADPDQVRPAEFYSLSTSGSVVVDFPTAAEVLPERTYIIHAESHSNSVSGTFLLGRQTTFSSKSGSITAKLLPYLQPPSHNDDEEADDDDYWWMEDNMTTEKTYVVPSLDTDSTSGSTDLFIMDPVLSATAPARMKKDLAFTTMHASSGVSGQIKISYPQTWSGLIRESSTSGSLSASGKGVVLEEDRSLPWARALTARKGNGTGKIDVRTVSGSVDVHVR